MSLESPNQCRNNYGGPLNNTGLDGVGPLTGGVCGGFFSVNTVNILWFPYGFLNFFFSFLCVSLSQFMEIIQYTMHITYNSCVNPLFMLSVRLPVNSRLSALKFWGESKVIQDFHLWGVKCINLMAYCKWKRSNNYFKRYIHVT